MQNIGARICLYEHIARIEYVIRTLKEQQGKDTSAYQEGFEEAVNILQEYVNRKDAELEKMQQQWEKEIELP